MRISSGIDRSVRRERIVWLVWVLCGLAIMLAASAPGHNSGLTEISHNVLAIIAVRYNLVQG